MGLTQTRQLILLGFLLVGLGVVGLYDAVVVSPACTWILSDVRVCEPKLSRAIPSLLVGLVGVAVLFGNSRKLRSR